MVSHRENPFENSFTIDEISSLPLDQHIQETDTILIDNDKTGHLDQKSHAAATITPEVSASECEMLYGAAMETAHALVATRKDGVSHRELPEDRRRAQGKILQSICTKYSIQIPTELEVIIFGGALIADWQYMTVKESNQEAEPAKIDANQTTLEV